LPYRASHGDSNLIQLELAVKQLIGMVPPYKQSTFYPRHDNSVGFEKKNNSKISMLPSKYFLEASVAGTVLPTDLAPLKNGAVSWDKTLLLCVLLFLWVCPDALLIYLYL
jgi:hypothetical protein